MSIIGITGHRSIYGYNLNDYKWQNIKNIFKNILIENQCTEGVTGMALGTDMIFAIAIIELKQEGYNIKLHCAIPCKNHSSRWYPDSIKLYNYLLSQADIVKYVSTENYQPYLMQKRNEYIVDYVDKMIALWNGLSGGTANCVKYAKKKNKDIMIINPDLVIDNCLIERMNKYGKL